MIGAVIIVFVCVIALPLAFFGLATALSVLASFTLTHEAEASHEGSELIATNK